QRRGDVHSDAQVHPAARPRERGAPEAAGRRLLAQLHRRRRRGDAQLRRGALLGRGVAHRELPPERGATMTIVWALLVTAGAVSFLSGARSADATQVWSIYLVNLVF